MSFRRSGPVTALALLLISTPVLMAAADTTGPHSQANQQISARAQKLIDRAEREGPQRVIVGLGAGFVPEGRLRASAVTVQRQGIADRQAALMASLTGLTAVEHHRFRYIPFLVLEAGAPALRRIAASSMVTSLEEDRAEPPVMASSNPIIGSGNAWAAGYEGTAWTVAVLDTGVDKTHPFFATRSKVVSEACYSSTVTSQKSTSVCPGGVAASTANGSGLNCPLDVEGCAHGTHVAGSVAGDDQTGPNFGVARSADIIAIQVFSSFDNPVFCGRGYEPCALSYVSDQIAGLERVYELRDVFNIAAVNMSLGSGNYANPAECDADEEPRKAAIDTLRSAGIATVVASGNSNSRNTISTPACISSAVSVGSTTDGDSVSGFSNVADYLDLLAPGSSITSSVPGGAVSTWNGTSMASPHVAGAWAVLKEAAPAADVTAILTALRDTGTPVDDNRSNGTVTDMRRINVDLALSVFGSSFPEFESDPAPGSEINFGAIPQGTVSNALEVQVNNLGDAELTVECAVSGVDAEMFEVVQCPESVSAAAGDQVLVNCRPSAPGELSASLDLATNDSDENMVAYPLLCAGSSDSLFSDGFELQEGN
jgi:subtilisin family serine protease